MYAFILPGVLYFLVFIYLPLLGNMIAFKDYSPFLGFESSPWVGLDNFERLFTDPDFKRRPDATRSRSRPCSCSSPSPPRSALALLLNSLVSERTKRTIQSIVYLPHFLSWVIVISLWQQVFGGAGFINQCPAQQGHGHDQHHEPTRISSSRWSSSRRSGRSPAGARSSSWPP